MEANLILKESTKKLLFEQHSSAGRAYNSQQDSLDKAFTTILFAEIGFYISKIKPVEGNFWADCVAVSFIALSLFIVFLSFIRGKATVTIHKELIEKEIYALDIPDSEDEKNELLQAIESDKQLYNSSNYKLSQLNRHIPLMIFISTCLCFLKASLTNTSIEIYLILLALYIIIGLIIHIYTLRKKK